METPQSASAPVTAPPRRWPIFLLGVLLFVMGPAFYFGQMRLGHLTMPWYVPALATFGVLFMALSVWQRRGLVRIVGLVVFVIMCGFEWFSLVATTGTPAYTGPVQVGGKLPPFATVLAGGGVLTNKHLENLEGGKGTLLVFFRGRW